MPPLRARHRPRPGSERDVNRLAFAVGAVFAALAGLIVGCEGCDPNNPSANGSPQALVVYTSVDEPYARPILDEFTKQTGVMIVLQTDTEATKSAGLAARLEAERDKPRADVWWGNEVFHTIRLADAGVLAPYESPSAKDVPAKFKDAEHRWAGCGLRARVIAVYQGETSGGLQPVALDWLLRDEFRGKVAMARPTAGTTGGHVAALYVLRGPDRFKNFFTRLKANEVKLLGGNGPVAEALGRGDVVLGLTDNDDVASVLRNGGKIRQHLPDQDATGTLTIPTTVALVKGTQRPEAAKKLVDYLLSREVERKLIDAQFAGWSVRAATSDIRSMDVDYRAVAKALPEAVQSAMTILEGRE
jgi:iron(III) transport system substrate-binding protein